MKIAQIAPLIESVPPRLYGGTERIVSYLTEELVALGHDVTLFASGDSITAANLVPCVPKALRLDASVRDPIPYYMLMLDRVRQRADDFDMLHFHIDQFQFPAVPADRGPHRHHAAWPPGPARSAAALSRLRRHAAGFDLQRPAPPRAERQLRGDRLSRPAGRPASPGCEARGDYRRLSRPHLAGEAARPRHRDCAGAGHSAQDRSQGGPRRRGLFPHADRAAARRPGRRVHRRDQRAAEDAISRRGAGAAVSRSTGRSRSASP